MITILKTIIKLPTFLRLVSEKCQIHLILNVITILEQKCLCHGITRCHLPAVTADTVTTGKITSAHSCMYIVILFRHCVNGSLARKINSFVWEGAGIVAAAVLTAAGHALVAEETIEVNDRAASTVITINYFVAIARVPAKNVTLGFRGQHHP